VQGDDPLKILATSVVIPVFNEVESLPELMRRCLGACRDLGPFELVLVDDGSSDGSRAIIREGAAEFPGTVVGIFLNRNYGQHAAIMAGFAACRGDLVVTLDADLQNPPEEIPRVVEALRQGNDVVGSVRAHRQDNLLRKLGSRVINAFTERTTGVQMTDYGCMLRGYRRHIVAAMLCCRERSTFIPVLANSFARRTTEIEVAHTARSSGESKYGLWNLVNLQFDLLTGMTKFPLRLLSITGAVLAFLGVGFGLILLILRIVHGAAWAAEGVFTLFAVLFIILGIQFVGMGILGEYLGRVFDDVRARPRYFISHVAGHSDLRETADVSAAAGTAGSVGNSPRRLLGAMVSDVDEEPEARR
jgi:undecaprenyl-phosphate 4-deoxy-4-formamido-L-arabinose transferase